MDPVNIIFGAAYIYGFVANSRFSAKEFKQKGVLVEKPKTYLQTVPLNLSAFISLLQIIAIFGLGQPEYGNEKIMQIIRIICVVLYFLSVKAQISSFNNLGKSYSKDIAYYKSQEIITDGMFKYFRHPGYVFQIAANVMAGIALFNPYLVAITLLAELPLYIMRAKCEESLLSNHNGTKYTLYKSKTII